MRALPEPPFVRLFARRLHRMPDVKYWRFMQRANVVQIVGGLSLGLTAIKPHRYSEVVLGSLIALQGLITYLSARQQLNRLRAGKT